MVKSTNSTRSESLRSRILSTTSVAVLGLFMLGGTSYAAEAPVHNDAPIATNTGIVKTAQVTQQPNRAGSLAAGEDEDEIVVEGIRSSLEKAIEVKRNADNILDGISAEGIGRFPDINLAESLQRISGVQIVRDDFRSGNVAIRGLTGFSKTQINGQDLAAPDFGGAFVYGIFESSVLGGVDVMKTPHVRMDTGGIAGVVNLKTRNALDFEDDKHLYLSAKGQYEGLNQAIVPDLGASAGFKNAAGDFGAFVSVGYQKKDFRSDSFKITEYRAIDGTYRPNAFGEGPRTGSSTPSAGRLDTGLSGGALDALAGDLSGVTFVPMRARYTSRGTTGNRISIAGGAEWQPSDDLHFNLTGIFAKDHSEQPLNSISLMTFGGRGFRFNILDTVDEGQFGTTATRISIESPQMQVQNRIRDRDFQTYALTLNGDWEKGPWNVHSAVHFTAGETQQSQHQIVSRIESRPNALSFNDRIFIDNGLKAELSFDPNDRYSGEFTLNRPFNDINTFGWSTTNVVDPITGEVVNNSDELFAGIFTGSTNNYEREQDQIAIQFDVNRDVNISLIESVDFGAKFKSRSQSNRRKSFRSLFNRFNGRNNGNYYNIGAWDNSLFVDSFLDDGSGYFGGRTTFPGLLVPDARAALAALRVNTGELVDDGLTLDQIDPETGLVFNALGTGIYDVSKDTLALYANANFSEEIPTLGINLRGNFGFRYVDTSRVAETSAQNTISAFPGFDDSVERVDVRGEIDFSHFLPQANIILDITDNFTTRFSWSKTLNDLNPKAVQAGSNITARTRNGSRTVSRSSDQSQLLPNTATSFDLAAEWYNRSGSTVHGALFTKEINDSVIIQSICEDAATVPGVAPFISGALAFNAQGQCFDTSGTRFNLSRRFNTDDSFRVSGAEFGFTQNLDFLEGLWANFGITANYTYLKKHKPVRTTTARFDTTGAFVGNTNILDQLSLSPHSFNVIPYYETDKFGVRLAGNFRSHFVDSRTLGGFLGADRIVDDRMQWDISGSYNVNDRLKLGAEIINIFNQDRYEYQGVEGRFRNLFSEGRTMTMYLSYNFF